jgi:hypothetical protein
MKKYTYFYEVDVTRRYDICVEANGELDAEIELDKVMADVLTGKLNEEIPQQLTSWDPEYKGREPNEIRE